MSPRSVRWVHQLASCTCKMELVHYVCAFFSQIQFLLASWLWLNSRLTNLDQDFTPPPTSFVSKISQGSRGVRLTFDSRLSLSLFLTCPEVRSETSLFLLLTSGVNQGTGDFTGLTCRHRGTTDYLFISKYRQVIKTSKYCMAVVECLVCVCITPNTSYAWIHFVWVMHRNKQRFGNILLRSAMDVCAWLNLFALIKTTKYLQSDFLTEGSHGQNT